MIKRRFTFIDLSQEDTMFYKGIAILMIIMHNFFHWLTPKTGENEQYLDPNRIKIYLDTIIDQPEYFFQVTFSFLGHYGVQVFLFLSAYGLTKKYFNSNLDYGDFLKKRVLKLYPAFLLSIVLWAFYVGLKYGGPINVINDHWQSLLYKILLIANFIPGELYAINGPWWFVSLIFQFYVIFPFMLYFFKKYGNVSLVVISVLGLAMAAYLQPLVGIQLAGTVLIHLPELSFGIFLARHKNFTLNYLSIFIIIIIFILSNFYYSFWYLSYINILILLLILFQKILLTSSGIFK